MKKWSINSKANWFDGKKSSLNKLPARNNQREETETAQLDESESQKTRGLMPIIGFLNGLGKRRLFF